MYNLVDSKPKFLNCQDASIGIAALFVPEIGPFAIKHALLPRLFSIKIVLQLLHADNIIIVKNSRRRVIYERNIKIGGRGSGFHNS